jgi:hypothetical protein
MRLLKGAKILNEVVIRAKTLTETDKLEQSYTNGLFKGGISTNFNVGNDPKAMNNRTIFQYLQNKIGGLQIKNAVVGYPSVTWRDDGVYFFLNNIQVDAGDVKDIPMSEFEYVKVYDPASGGMFGVYGGVIAMYTKKSKTGYSSGNKNNTVLTLTGYTPIKEFYSPDYATIVNTDAQPDLRTTLYWNPNIILNKTTREQTIKFYNNDVTRRFKIVIEGMNADSKLIHIEQVY